jgi:hypothetical protein
MRAEHASCFAPPCAVYAVDLETVPEAPARCGGRANADARGEFLGRARRERVRVGRDLRTEHCLVSPLETRRPARHLRAPARHQAKPGGHPYTETEPECIARRAQGTAAGDVDESLLINLSQHVVTGSAVLVPRDLRALIGDAHGRRLRILPFDR